MKFLFKILVVLFAIMFFLVGTLYMVFYVVNQPKYQTRIAQEITQRLSEQYGTKITIDKVDLRFFNKATLNKLYIEDTKGDTLLYAAKVDTRISVFDPFNNTFRVENANFEDVKIRINNTKEDPTTNLAYLIKRFEKKGNANKKVSSKSSKKQKKELHFNLKKASFKNFDLLVDNQYNHQYQVVQFPNLKIDVQQFNLKKKRIVLQSLNANKPVIKIVKTKFIQQDGNVQTQFGTPEGWHIAVKHLNLKEGLFRSKGKDKGIEKAKQFMFNDFEMNKLNINAKNVLAKNNRLDLFLENLSFEDFSGFIVKKMQANAWFSNKELGFKNLRLNTPGSTINGDVVFDVNYLEDFSFFEERVNLDASLSKVKLVPTDLAYLFGKSPTREAVYITGRVQGTVDNLDTEDFELRFEHGSLIKGDIHARGLPDVMNTYFDAKVNQLKTSSEGIRLIAQVDELPEQITKFGNISYTGEFTGYLTNLVAFGEIKTDIGTFETDVQYNGQDGGKIYRGYISTEDFQLGYWLGKEDQFGMIDFSGSVNGSEFDLTKMDTDIDVEIRSIDFRKSTYKNIEVKGNLNAKVFDGKLDAKDEELYGIIDGMLDFSQEQLKIDVTSDIQNINLTQLQLVKDNIQVKGKFDATMLGSNLDSFRGQINAKDASVIINGQETSFKEFDLDLYDNPKGQQVIKVGTETIDAEIIGKYQYSQLANTFLKTANKYYNFRRGWDSLENTIQSDEAIGFKINISKEDQLIEQYVSGLEILEDIYAEGEVNPVTNEISLIGSTDEVAYKNISIKGWEFDAIGDGEALYVNSFQDEIYNNGKKWFVNSELNFEFDGDEVLADIRTYNEEFLDAKLKTRLTQLNDKEFKLEILTSNLIIAEQNWTIEEGNSITFGGEQWSADNFVLTNGEEKIEIFAPVAKSDTKLIAQFVDFRLDGVNNLVGFTDKPIGGVIGGEIQFKQVNKELILDSDLYVSSLMYNNNVIDDVKVNGAFNVQQQEGSFKGKLIDDEYKAEVQVDVDLKNKAETVIVAADLERASLGVFEQMWGKSISDVEGAVDGLVRITINNDGALFGGKVTLIEDLGVTLDFTQARYTAEKGQAVDIRENGFFLNDLKLTDEFGHKAKLSGGILHSYLTDFSVDLTGEYENFLFLNTTPKDNEVFYGTAFADGTLTFTGPVSDVVMNINATTRENTKINIVPQSSKEIGEYDFIRFKKPKTDTVEVEKAVSKSKLTMKFDLDVTPVADLFMSFDESNYNTLRGNGNGALKVNFDTQGLLEIFGIYNVSKGAYVVNFEEVLTKTFDIQEGGSIRWNGDPYSAILDIEAVYNVNADISELLQEGTTIGTASGTTKSPTKIKVHLTESLDQPKFTYEIDVPNANTGGLVNERVKVINNNKDLLDRQLFSLLLLDRFSGVSSNPFEGEGAINDLAINSVTNIIANQLTSLISEVDALRNTDIGIDFENYRDKFLDPTNPNTGLDQQIQLSVAQQIGQKVRLSVGSDFNFGKELAEENEIFQVRDIIMEIDINSDRKYELKFFVKQDYSISSQENDYRNGISYVFEKEYRSFKDIFRKKTAEEKDAIRRQREEVERLKELERQRKKQKRKARRQKTTAVLSEED